MATVDRTTLEDWIQRELDGDLGPQEERLLKEQLRLQPDLAAERRQLQGMLRSLEDSRIAVGDDFRAQVMAGLPPAAWEVRAARSWRLPVALLAALFVGLVALVRYTPGLALDGPLTAAVGAVGDLIVTSVVTGAGLLGASWQGLQAGLAELFSTSPVAAIGLIALLLGLNGLFFLGLRSRRLRRQESAGREDGPSS